MQIHKINCTFASPYFNKKQIGIMIKIIYLLLLPYFFILLISCSTQKKSENVVGVGRTEVEEERLESEEDDEIEVVYLTPDANSVAIGLLADSVSLAAEGDSVVVKTQKQIWWLVGFDFYEDSDPRSKCGYYNCTSDERRESHWGVWVNYQWLSVYASSHDKLVKIKVDKNTTGKTRYWRVVLEIGDIFNSVYCQQPSM